MLEQRDVTRVRNGRRVAQTLVANERARNRVAERLESFAGQRTNRNATAVVPCRCGQIHLVDGEDALRACGLRQQTIIFVRQGLARVQNEHDEIGNATGTSSARDAFGFNDVVRIAPARSVNEGDRDALDVHRFSHEIACGARHRGHYGTRNAC